MTKAIRNLSNEELFKAYSGERGDISAEMCRRAGMGALERHGSNEIDFQDCMKYTIDIFNEYLLRGNRKNDNF